MLILLSKPVASTSRACENKSGHEHVAFECRMTRASEFWINETKKKKKKN